jgi:hypothetical protein
MAKKVLGYPSWDIEGGLIASSQTESAFVQGQFVGMTSDGVKLADYRAAQGPIPALGVLREDMQRKDPRGNVITREPMLSWVSHCRVAGFSTLTKGAYYYLGTAGNLGAANTPQAAQVGDLDQIVGVALTTDVLKVTLGGFTKKTA